MRLLPAFFVPILLSGAMLLLPASGSAQSTESMSSASASTSFSDALNGYRAQHGLRSVVIDAELTAAAQAYAEDMASHGHFSHEGRDGSNSGDRAHRAGCSWRHVGENLGWGQTSEGEVIQGWVNSDGHNRNLLGANFARYGLARVGTYWVLMFADGC